MQKKYSFNDNLNKAIKIVSSIKYFTTLIDSHIFVSSWENNNKHLGSFSSADVMGFVFFGGNTSNICKIHISTQNKMTVGEIVFLVILSCLYTSFGLFKNYENQSKNEKKANFLYVFSYVYNVMGYQSVPSFWSELATSINLLNAKNKESVLTDLESNPEIYSIFSKYGFCNSTFHDDKIVMVSASELSSEKYSMRTIKRSFEDAFASGIIENAAHVLKQTTDTKVSKAHHLQEWFFRNYPFFSSLSAMFHIETSKEKCRDRGIHYGAVDFNIKTIYLNEFNLPVGIDGVSQQQIFVMAHEMLHVALNHAKRRKNREPLMWNLACDFVINNWLVEMCVGVPPAGVFLDKKMSTLSAEEIYEILKENRDILREMITMASTNAGHKYNKHKNKKSHLDMFGDDDEGKEYPDMEDAAAKALLQGYDVHCNLNRGLLPSGLEEEIRILQQPVIAWQVELASWFARHFPEQEKKRTNARASRRQDSTPDIPRPAYYTPIKETKTKTFGVILDTSGSMDSILLGKSLGTIAAYAKQYNVFEVKLIYCDASPYDAGYVKVDSLRDRIKVTGRGGTVLQQAVNYLQNNKDFPNKAPILVLTDGFFEPDLQIKNSHAFVVPDKRVIRGRKNVFEFN